MDDIERLVEDLKAANERLKFTLQEQGAVVGPAAHVTLVPMQPEQTAVFMPVLQKARRLKPKKKRKHPKHSKHETKAKKPHES